MRSPVRSRCARVREPITPHGSPSLRKSSLTCCRSSGVLYGTHRCPRKGRQSFVPCNARGGRLTQTAGCSYRCRFVAAPHACRPLARGSESRRDCHRRTSPGICCTNASRPDVAGRPARRAAGCNCCCRSVAGTCACRPRGSETRRDLHRRTNPGICCTSANRPDVADRPARRLTGCSCRCHSVAGLRACRPQGNGRR